MTEENSKNQPHQRTLPKPSQYMRARHPELFSDTALTRRRSLDKAQLEYHLETLTSRKQEQVFEEFCRRLAECEICPNLKPQTGPTGGGDSGVDASTYPVAPTLAERCYWGTPNPPSEEHWAFAFSCKKKWLDKVREDTDKIARLGRRYQKVFFISNQFIPDRKRASIEIELGQLHGFELHIHDRTWIINTVMEHKRELLAIEILGIRGIETEKPQLGPRDLSRQQEFDGLLGKLGQPELYYGNDYAMAQDYLTAAKLARGLAGPRHEVDGLFARSRSLAEKHGYEGQIIRCGYHHAWTSFWWYDDPGALEKIYSEIEGCLTGTADAEDCELFSNLLLLLSATVNLGEIPAERARLGTRVASVELELRRMANEKSRPNNALYSETLLHLMDLYKAIVGKSDPKLAFGGLKKCLRRSIGLGTYPAMRFIDNLTDMGSFIGNLPGYDELFEEIRRVAKKRFGESSEGKLLYERGLQLLDKGSPKDILRYLGQARVKLAKDETLRESIRAALGCCDAYVMMGLYWAARMEVLSAAHLALRTVEAAYEFPIEGVLAAKRMAWLELVLGRIAPFIAWYDLSWLLVGQLRSLQYKVEGLEEDLWVQEGILGCFFLNLSADDAREIADLKHGLDGANLPMARLALLYSLGDTDSLVRELPEDLATDRQKRDDFFAQWKAQPASEQIPKTLTGETRSYCQYETTILGVRFRVETRGYFGPVVFSENLLGIIEVALALAKWENLAFVVDEVNVCVDVDESGHNPPALDLRTPPDPKGYNLVWQRDMVQWMNITGREQVGSYLVQFLLKILLDTTVDPWDDLKRELDNWHKQETFSRIVASSPTSIAVMDVIGEKQYEFAYWCKSTPAS